MGSAQLSSGQTKGFDPLEASMRAGFKFVRAATLHWRLREPAEAIISRMRRPRNSFISTRVYR